MMEHLEDCSENNIWQLPVSHFALLRYFVEDSKTKFVSARRHVISSIVVFSRERFTVTEQLRFGNVSCFKRNLITKAGSRA